MITPIEYFKKGWELIHDPENCGVENKWYEGIPEGAVKAEVPSWVHMYLPECYGAVWYQYRFDPKLVADENNVVILRFGAVDFIANVWLNGKFVGKHVGAEDVFSFDVTEFVDPAKENLLVLRVSKPYFEDFDGYTFGEIPKRNQLKRGLNSGSAYNTFGIGGPVCLMLVPKISIDDAFIYANPETGCIEVSYTLKNRYDRCLQAELKTMCGNKRTGELESQDIFKLSLMPGDNKIKRIIPIEDVLLWSVDDPNLYFVNMSLTAEKTVHQLNNHCGFRTFEVRKDGYFYLNGKRVFVKCAHSGNVMPESTFYFPRDKSFIRKDFIMAKAMGMNMIRIPFGVALPEQLDYCDEIGLMIYQEPLSSWLQENGPRAKELYQHDLFNMIIRDRNHPCITAWGFLNETFDSAPRSDTCYIAHESLAEARELDPTRLIIYSSGRWDGDVKYGSISNPFTTDWQPLWNEEGADIKSGLQKPEHISGYPGGFVPHMGDVHAYPQMPISAACEKMLRELGSKTKRPVFYSEVGMGTLFDVIWLKKKYDEMGSNPEYVDTVFISKMAACVEQDFKRYKLDEEFAFPIDIMKGSHDLHNRHRQAQFNMIRSNPYACGYSVTGLYDHGYCGEGLYTLMREWKPGIADTAQAGFAPLKWCLFVDKTHIYSGREFEIEGVLANEDILKLRDYDIEVKITGKDGVVYSEAITLHITEEALKYMAVPVFKKKIVLDVPEGEYELRAEILQGAAAFDGRLKFFVSEDKKTVTTLKSAVIYGIGEKAEKLLTEKGVSVKYLCNADEREKAVVLLGTIPDDKKEEVWSKLNRMLANGSRIIVTDRCAFKKDDDYEYYIPLENKPENLCHITETSSDMEYIEWLYHNEYIVKKSSPYFKNLPKGMMNWDYYMHLISGQRFEYADGQEPDSIDLVCIGTGVPTVGEFQGSILGDRVPRAAGYQSGVNIASYNVEAGALVINSLNILDNIGVNPAADRLLLNILTVEGEKI